MSLDNFKIFMQKKELAICVSHLSKHFDVSENKTNTVKQFVFNFMKKEQTKKFEALSDISFEIEKGEIVGFIGRNGSGKSTLTKVIAGIYPPTFGKIKINGTIMLMNLGIGINQELTARDNIYVACSILGRTIKEIDVFFDELLSFAELNEFANRKVKYFSSGMQARLSFAIALHAKAEIIILDEVFAVGDAKFIQKATAAIENKILKNSTIILISHSEDTIRKYCHKTGYLKNGQLVFFGDTNLALEKYKSDNN